MVQSTVKVFMVGGHGMMMCSCLWKENAAEHVYGRRKTMQGNDDSSCKWGGLNVVGLEERKEEEIGPWEQEKKRERRTWP